MKRHRSAYERRCRKAFERTTELLKRAVAQKQFKLLQRPKRSRG